MTLKNCLYAFSNVISGLIVLIALAGLIQAAVWALDNQPPTRMLGAEVPPVFAGDTVIVTEKVERDKDRPCGARHTRILFDSIGTPFDIQGGAQTTNAAAREKRAALSPGKLTFTVKVPPEAASGPATIVTTMQYTCNPLHQLFPIEAVTIVNLEIL